MSLPTIRILDVDRMIFSPQHHLHNIYENMEDIAIAVSTSKNHDKEIFLQIFSSTDSCEEVIRFIGMNKASNHNVVKYENSLYCHLIHESFENMMTSAIDNKVSFVILSKIDEI